MAKKRQRRKAERPAEILEAAVQEFAESGFGGAKMANIARRAGVAKGTVYLYFETKEDVFKAIVNDQIRPVLAGIEQMVARKEELPDFLTASAMITRIIQHFYSEMVENEHRRMILRILISDGHRFPELTKFYHDEILSKAQHVMRTLVTAGVASGEFRESAVAAQPMVIMGPALMASIWKITFEQAKPLPVKQFAEAHIQMVLDALKVHESAS